MRGYDARLRKNRLTEGKIGEVSLFFKHYFPEICHSFFDSFATPFWTAELHFPSFFITASLLLVAEAVHFFYRNVLI